MTTFTAAYTKAGTSEFVVVLVRDHIVNSPSEADDLVVAMRLRFRCPVALLGESNRRLYGDPNLVRALSKADLSRLPWRKWSVAA